MYLAKLFVEPFSSGTFVELFVNDCCLGDFGAQIIVSVYAHWVIARSPLFMRARCVRKNAKYDAVFYVIFHAKD